MDPIQLNPKLFINNEFLNAFKDNTLEVYNPANGKIIMQVSSATEFDVDLAVASALKAFNSNPWKNLSNAERGHLIWNLAELIDKNKNELSHLHSKETGKNVNACLNVDIAGAVENLKYFAALSQSVIGSGRVVNCNDGYLSYVLHEPVGVCGLLIPWNSSLYIMITKLANALVVGNTVVVKTSKKTPLSSAKIAELTVIAGFPPGVINILTGEGKLTGEALVRHPDVDMISFAGSQVVGRRVLALASDTIKRVTLELSGKGTAILCADSDILSASKLVCESMFHNTGRSIVALSRVYVHKNLFDKFLMIATDYCQHLKVCDPCQCDPCDCCDIGPVISEDQFWKTLQYIKNACDCGTHLVTGGKRVGSSQHYIEPTILANPSDALLKAGQEIFGPVVCVTKFSDQNELIKKLNLSDNCLWSSVHTKTVDNANRFSMGLKSGTVTINCNYTSARLPFGGLKQRGRGREGGLESLMEYTEVKVVTTANEYVF